MAPSGSAGPSASSPASGPSGASPLAPPGSASPPPQPPSAGPAVRRPYARLAVGLIVLLAALGALVLVLWAAGAPPAATLAALAEGSFGGKAALVKTFSALVPLLLCAASLLLTYAAGLWNIGVEGQITMGAVFCLGALRLMPPSEVPTPLALAGGLGAAAAGGALWAALAGVLKVKGRVHEIFSGLGLNFVATGVTLWLILGPWKRPGMASLSGTEPLAPDFRLPFLPGANLSPVGLALAAAAYAGVVWLLSRTTFGLSLRAIRQNPTAAGLLGLSPERRLVEVMALGGGLAGLAGGLLLTGLYHRLIPSLSGNYGYTAILAVLLAGLGPALTPLACLFFAALSAGSIRLPLDLSLDSSLSGVIQGMFVLAILAARRAAVLFGRRVRTGGEG